MNILKAITVFGICAGLILCTPACVVFVKKDNGLHRGWRNPKNPHNPNSVKKDVKPNGNGNKGGKK
jgi:hypothetical protein